MFLFLFSLRARKDLRDLFDQLAITCRSMSDSSLNDGSIKSSPEHAAKPPQRIGKIQDSYDFQLELCLLDFYILKELFGITQIDFYAVKNTYQICCIKLKFTVNYINEFKVTSCICYL
jgi:hypothetical protein